MGTWASATAKHLSAVVLPLVDQITNALGLPKSGFELCAANVNAASAADLGIRISGYSADVPVFLALLSAATGIQLPEDVAATGQVASPPERSPPSELCPRRLPRRWRMDRFRGSSTHDWIGTTPWRCCRPLNLPLPARRFCRGRRNSRWLRSRTSLSWPRPCSSDQSVVLASLEQGFFGHAEPSGAVRGAVSRIIRFLIHGNAERFWHVSGNLSVAGPAEQRRCNIRPESTSSIRHQAYPAGLGLKLLQLLRSLPPAIRASQTQVPFDPSGQVPGAGEFGDRG